MFVRGLVLKCNLVGLVLGIEGHLCSFVEHVIVYTRGDIEKIDLLSLIETQVLFNLAPWFVWFFLYADVVLDSRSLVVCDTTLKVEDVSLNCTERVVVTNVETCCGSWLSRLGSFLNNLNALSRNKVVLNPTFCALFRLDFLSCNGLCLVKLVFGSLFLFVDRST